MLVGWSRSREPIMRPHPNVLLAACKTSSIANIPKPQPHCHDTRSCMHCTIIPSSSWKFRDDEDICSVPENHNPGPIHFKFETRNSKLETHHCEVGLLSIISNSSTCQHVPSRATQTCTASESAWGSTSNGTVPSWPAGSPAMKFPPSASPILSSSLLPSLH